MAAASRSQRFTGFNQTFTALIQQTPQIFLGKHCLLYENAAFYMHPLETNEGKQNPWVWRMEYSSFKPLQYE